MGLLLPLILACKSDPIPPVVLASPDRLPSFGYERVTLDLAQSGLDAGAITEATVAGLRAYDLVVEGETLTLTVQGAAQAGPAELRLTDGQGVHSFSDVLSYDPPVDPAFERTVVVGASLGMGVQSAGASPHGQLASPAALIARQLGAHLPLPMFVDGLFGQVQPDDVGAPPECALPDAGDFATAAIADTLALLRDPESDAFGFQYGRVDADLAPRNLSVPGSSVCDLARGPGDFGEAFLSHLVYDPYAELADPVVGTQLALALEAQPTLVISVDLLANDLIDAAMDPSLDLSAMTSTDELRTCLEEVLTLADTGALVVLGNAPDVNVLPTARQNVARILAEGTMSADEVALALTEIRARVIEANALLAELAAAHPNVHVVDVFSAVDQLDAEGVTIGDQTLTTAPLGGLISLDGLHFTDVGYAVFAALFLDDLAELSGAELPALDLEQVLAGDPYSPDALRAAGLDPGACEGAGAW